MYSIFGIGNIAEKTINKLGISPVHVYDNNPGTWGRNFAGTTVKNPSEILSDDFGEIVICTTSYKEVIQQLKTMNLFDYRVSPVLANIVEIDRIEELSIDLIFISGLPSHTSELSGGGVFRLKGTFQNYELTKIHSGNCHGLTTSQSDPSKIYITDTSQGILVLNKETLIIEKIINNDLTARPHGIFVAEENKIFLACSYEDAVHLVDDLGNVIDTFHISENNQRSEKGLATHHVNDLSVYGDNIFVSMFSASGSWQQGFLDGAIKKINMTTKVISTIYNDLQMPHNIEVNSSGMHFCNSLCGEVLTNNRKVVYRGNGFVRGLSSSNEYYIIGESKNRNFASIDNVILNNCLDTRLNFVDKKTLAYKSIQLPEGISEIHAIMDLTNV